jgi:hypothetical protein
MQRLRAIFAAALSVRLASAPLMGAPSATVWGQWLRPSALTWTMALRPLAPRCSAATA